MNDRPRLLDLFCGGGGASAGYVRAGFEVTGVDIADMPRYSGSGGVRFIRADAVEYLRDHGHEYDAIHASPPCQRFSTMTKRWRRQDDHPDLVEPTRDLLLATGRPYVIENVVGAPLRDPVLLCGSMFGLGAMVDGVWQQLRRHRVFESDLLLWPPAPCSHAGRAIGVYGHPGGRSVRDGIRFAQHADWRTAMDIDWMSLRELTESIPPAYTEWIGQQLMLAVGGTTDD